jgi:hypothetical protein
MQVRPSVRPLTVVAKRPAAAAPVAKAAVQAAPAPAAKAKAPVKVMTDAGFGSDMLQHSIFALTNLGQFLPLGPLSAITQALPGGILGIVDVGYGLMNGFKDVIGLKKANNTKKSDDFTRIGGDAGMVLGGVALVAGAAIAPWVPLVGAGVAAAGFLARAVGIWNDETRW